MIGNFNVGYDETSKINKNKSYLQNNANNKIYSTGFTAPVGVPGADPLEDDQ
jgi:hypothetical protein